MKKALIGYTGFVGSNLQTQIKFDDFYNSKNIQDIKTRLMYYAKYRKFIIS